MGLDFHTEGIPYEEDVPFEERAHWSYSGFDRFRERLAREIESSRSRQHLLQPLLEHSDCDGVLSPDECKVLSRELANAVWNWEPANDYDRINALKLCLHMDYCAQSGRNLIFA